MKLNVYINEVEVHSEPVSMYSVDELSRWAHREFKIDLLKECGVNAYVALAEVPSKMNTIAFSQIAEKMDDDIGY